MKLSLAMIGQEGGDAVLIELLDRLGRHRALADDESQLLEKLVRQSQATKASVYHKWSREDDRTLLRVQHRPRGVANYAKEIGVSEYAAWMRLDRLRKKLRGEGNTGKVER